MLYFHHSNRYEILRRQLLEELQQARRAGGVFERTAWITPSRAIADDISRALAQKEGVALNLDACFLAQWIWRELGRSLPEVHAQAEFLAPAAMAWHVFSLLREPFLASFPRLQNYLEKTDDSMQFELAQQLAQLFDLYLLARPEWLQAWQNKPASRCLPHTASAAALADERWQAALWQRLASNIGLPARHPFELWLDTLRQDAAARARLPRSVRVFCLPAIAPQYLQVLYALAEWMEVHLYALNACEEYWFDLVDEKRLQRLAAADRAAGFEVIHPLLATLGKQSQVSMSNLFDHLPAAHAESSHYEAPQGAAMLARIQRSLLTLEPDSASGAPDDTDRSIEIHCCHSLTRELEVLHDYLLELLRLEPALSVADIVVGLPDPATAAPLIEAVFGASAKSARIPWQISGQPMQHNAVAQLLIEIMQWLDGHMAAEDLMALLHNPLLGETFALSAADLYWLHDALDAAAARWGLNTAQVQALDLPAQAAANSLQAALQRLLLAWVWGEDDNAVYFAACTPAANPHGINDTARLGALATVLEHIERLRAFASQPHSVEQWCEAVRSLIAALVSKTAERLDSIAALHSLLAQMSQQARQAAALCGKETAVSLKVFRLALEAALQHHAPPASATGCLTFAPISALRGLPAAVICLPGLNEDVFPGTTPNLEFDLTAAAPRATDRNRSIENRGLFLDCLLAARKRLYLSWSGQDMRDNSARAPSSVITALLDELGRCCALDAAAVERRFCVRHPLQAFATEYFLPAEQKSDRRLLSFRAQYAVCRDQQTPPAFFSAAPNLPGSPPASNATSPQALIDFWRNPARALLRHQFSLSLHDSEPALPVAELFNADHNTTRLLAQHWLPWLLHVPALPATLPAAWLQAASASGHYPPAAFGTQWLQAQYTLLAELAGRIREASGAAQEQQYMLDLRLDNGHISGLLAGVYAAGVVLYRHEKCNIRDQLSAWLSHLMLCAAAPRDIALQTRHIGLDGAFHFPPLAQQAARAHLEKLLLCYQNGLEQAFAFFPKSAAALVQALRKKTPADPAAAHRAALDAANKIWQGERWPESGEASIRFLWRDHPDPLAQMVHADYAPAILDPLFDAIKEG